MKRAALSFLLAVSLFIPPVLGGAGHGAADDLIIREARPVRPDPSLREDLPRSFWLEGTVVDQYNQAVPGAEVRVLGRRNHAVTDAQGRFRLPAKVSAKATVACRHPGYVPRRLPAQHLYRTDGKGARFRLRRYTIEFRVGPEGGSYKRKIRIEVPPGAVREEITIRAAVLPLNTTYSEGPEFQGLRLAGIEFGPEGLMFLKPIRVRVPVDRKAHGMIRTVQARVLDPRSGKYVADEQISVAFEGSDLVFSLKHFSGVVALNPEHGVSRHLLRRGTKDQNGDRRVNSHDVEYLIVLSGGPHIGTYSVARGSGHTLIATRSRSTEESTARTRSGSAGVNYGPAGVSIRKEEKQEKKIARLRRAGLSTEIDQVDTSEIDVQVAEGQAGLWFLYQIYDYYLVREWKSFTPSAREEGALERAFRETSDSGSPWAVFNILSPSGLIVGRTIYEGDQVLVRTDEDGTRSFYRRTGEYVERVPVQLEPKPMPSRPITNPEAFRVRGQTLEDASFFPGGDGGMISVRSGGIGVAGKEKPRRIRNCECGATCSKRTKTVRKLKRTKEETTRQTEAVFSSTEVSASLNVPLAGGLGLSGNAASEESWGRAKTASQGYGEAFVSREETVMGWTVPNEHMAHRSNHSLYKLYRTYYTRHWESLFESEVPSVIKSKVQAGKRSIVPIRSPEGEQIVMRTPDGGWYVAGPPVKARQEVGFMLVRVDQIQCPLTQTAPPTWTRPPTTTAPPTAAPPPVPTRPPVVTPRPATPAAPPTPLPPAAAPPVLTRSPVLGNCARQLAWRTGSEHKAEGKTVSLPPAERESFMRYDLDIYLRSTDPSVTQADRACARMLLDYLERAPTAADRQWIADEYARNYLLGGR